MIDVSKIYTLTGPEPGKNVVLLAGVHGDETSGIEACKRILPSLRLDAGSATFAFGNLDAIREGKRFIESNLNRMFQNDAALSAVQRASAEYRRSRELMPLLEKADVLLDLHSSGTPDSIPFLICEPRSYEIAKHLPGTIISSGWDDVQPGGTDSFVNTSGGKGICFESGYHKDPSAIDRAEQAVYAFLTATGNLLGTRTEATSEKTYMRVSRLHKTQENFVPARGFKDFEQVKQGELIGTDGTQDVCASEDGFVLFVRPRSSPGEEAFLFAEGIK